MGNKEKIERWKNKVCSPCGKNCLPKNFGKCTLSQICEGCDKYIDDPINVGGVCALRNTCKASVAYNNFHIPEGGW